MCLAGRFLFNSFGAMLGLNFGKYLDDLGTDKVHNLDGVKIFKELEDAYAEYVSEKDKEEDDR